MPQDKKKSTYGKMGPLTEKETMAIPFNNAAIKRIMQTRKVGAPGAAGTTFVTKKPKVKA
jgi:hypothetical protein